MNNTDSLQFARIAAAIEYLYDHFREQPALEEVAAHVHVSPAHLKGTPFQLKVWQALLQIPAGRLKSYGGLAADTGQANAARAVGSAIGSNPVAVLIPCHRVIRESGIIGGYRWQRGRKMALLAKELERTV